MKSSDTDTASPASLLASLNVHIAQASLAAREAQGLDLQPAGSTWPPLRSAQRFGETWERLGAEVQVQQARQRAPRNAGPLNPQRLMVETLARMGELSPHYLRRFLAHAETLLWLEQAQVQLRQAAAQARGSAGKPAKAGRGRKQP
jgi:hypothetical protein